MKAPNLNTMKGENVCSDCRENDALKKVIDVNSLFFTLENNGKRVQGIFFSGKVWFKLISCVYHGVLNCLRFELLELLSLYLYFIKYIAYKFE
ncbi:hypothetical protein A1QC_07775 [Vibrio rumoiensis 1S-45]|uniref:Uncharacterized protein n=1 Tax=Vibrio rumoiensis 1S-45 TaxID=1188252 RepID=A0A1E5E2Y5_9VIBR|nr:hypothetical protein A1QC_07775 [Vibrio rumoiensis 1S-45]